MAVLDTFDPKDNVCFHLYKTESFLPLGYCKITPVLPTSTFVSQFWKSIGEYKRLAVRIYQSIFARVQHQFRLPCLCCDYVVVVILWARVSCRLTLKDACFRMRITLGVVLIRSLVCAICVPGRLRSGSGVALN